MLTLISPVDTPWHRFRAGPKLAALAAFSLITSTLDGAWLAWAAALVFALHLPGGQRLLRHALKMLRPLWPFLAILLLWGWWQGQLRHGAEIGLRMVVLVAAANLVTMTTRLSDMLEVFERLAQPLAPVLPPRRLALAFALMIRFIPAMGETLARLRQAWAARSRRRPGWRIMLPALLAALDTAEHAAEALRARGGAE